MNTSMLALAIRALCDTVNSELRNEVHSHELEEIVIAHAIGAAIAAMASGWIPGAGSAVAFGIGVTFVCSMYVRLANAMGITLGKGLIRAIASAVVADLAAILRRCWRSPLRSPSSRSLATCLPRRWRQLPTSPAYIWRR